MDMIELALAQPLAIPDWLSAIWDNPYVFIVFVTLVVGVVGMMTGSMAVGSWSAFMAFAFFAVESGIDWIEQLFIVLLVLIFVGFAFKIWRLEGGGAGS